MKYLSLALICLCSLLATAQEEVQFSLIKGLNSSEHEIVTGIWGDALLVSQTYRTGLISDWSEGDGPVAWKARYAPRRATWESISVKDWPLQLDERVNAVSYSKRDSAIYYSRTTSLGTYGIFRRSLVNGNWGPEEDLKLHGPDLDAVQPAISEAGDELLYVQQSSMKEGSTLMYAVSRAGVWSEGKALNDNINQPGYNLFPQWDGNDILFSSERESGMGGKDIYRATKSSQWEEVELLPTPINSAFNDLTPVMLNADRGFISTDRNDPAQGYDLMIFERIREEETVQGLTALLECKGVPVQDTEVEVMNASGETVYVANTGATGTFDLSELRLKQSYKVLFKGPEKEVLKHSFLYILNEQGERIMVFAPGADGMFIFELLPSDEVGGMRSLDERDDWTLLAIDLDGQVFEKEPGDIEEGVPIYVTDENGDLEALSYTTEKGKFHFDKLSPQAQYNISVDEESNATGMVIFDEGEETVIPLVEGKAEFERIPKEEVVSLINEKGDSIAIRKEETFIIEHIYYALNSAQLNLVAKYQLDQLANIMKQNADIRIELNSHTDSRGENEYNLELSQRRANSAVGYLLERGIAQDRMVAKGYGESKLLNKCKDGVVCAEEDHALNRRTEIKIFIR